MTKKLFIFAEMLTLPCVVDTTQKCNDLNNERKNKEKEKRNEGKRKKIKMERVKIKKEKID